MWSENSCKFSGDTFYFFIHKASQGNLHLPLPLQIFVFSYLKYFWSHLLWSQSPWRPRSGGLTVTACLSANHTASTLYLGPFNIHLCFWLLRFLSLPYKPSMHLKRCLFFDVSTSVWIMEWELGLMSPSVSLRMEVFRLILRQGRGYLETFPK